MLPFHRLLLATEHTEFDAGAERLALEMARHCRLPLSGVMPLASNPEYEAEAPELVARIEAEAMARIAALEALADAAGVELEMRVRRGEELWQEIVAEAREDHADLVIIRRRGKKSFLAELLVGDMVSKVAAQAPCSVLMVPRAGQMWRQRILVAIDASPSAERLVSVAVGIAAQCALPLSLVRVASARERPAAEAALAAAVERAAAVGVEASGEVLAGKVPEAVLAARQKLAADLLVIGLHGEETVALGSNAQALIAQSETPVLLVKP